MSDLVNIIFPTRLEYLAVVEEQLQAKELNWLAPYLFFIFPCSSSGAGYSLEGVLVHLVGDLGRESRESVGGRRLITLMVVHLGFWILQK